MRNNIKPEIIEISKQLFNERGYNQVSTQDIADAMGISKGNLNYHFKKKEDIMDAVVEEMHCHYIKPEPPATLEELNAFFLRVQKVATENAFYFWHYTQLSQTSEKIRQIQNTVIGDICHLLKEAFKLLHENGNLQREEYPGQYTRIIHAVVLNCIYWIPLHRLAESTDAEVNFPDCIWAIMYLLLTEEGKKQFKSTILKTFSG